DPRSIDPTISAGLAQIILKALQKDPGDRFAGCGEFLAAIEGYKQGKTLRTPERKWVSWAIGSALFIALGALMLFALYRPRPVPTFAQSTENHGATAASLSPAPVPPASAKPSQDPALQKASGGLCM